jgi:SAM-dependent methyltransferase
MSGFSADWLTLREPADHRARDRALLDALAGSFAGRDALRIVDLGCGTGSNLRATAPRLGLAQHWHLVDYDATLLAAARERLGAWADEAEAEGDDLRLSLGERRVRVSFHQADLAADPGAVLHHQPDLVTASALFDLVSVPWIERFAAAVAGQGAAFYTVLTYNGVEAWEPPHPTDAAVFRAFHAHQGGDKGFGPSAGPQATEALATAFRAQGYRVDLADSPWRLGPADRALVAELARGIAQAVRETGEVPEATIADWLQAREQAACTVGHTDCLALPGG